MSNQVDRFGDGLAIGVLVGSVFGGLVGALIANRFSTPKQPHTEQSSENMTQMQIDTEQVIGDARRTLDEKIAQLNEAIEATRDRLLSLEEVKTPEGPA